MANVEQDLIDLIQKICKQVVSQELKDNQVLKYESVIIASYNSTAKTATIYFPSDMTTASIYSYPNRSSHTLSVGQKAYLVYLYGNISQGYLTDNKPI